MTPYNTGHVGDALDDYLDGRLGTEEKGRVESHLSECAECRARREALSRLKTALRGRRGESAPELRDEVMNALARESAASSRWPRRAAVAAAIAAAILAAALLWRSGAPADVVAEAADSLAADRAGRLRLELRTSDPSALEEEFRRTRPGYTTRVFDLGMMGWQLAGGSPSSLGGLPSSLFVYADAEGRRLLCVMYPGRWEDLPAPDEVHEEKGFTFHVYRRGNSSLVFWKEAGAICVLAGDLPGPEVLALAVAKAS